MMKAQSMSALCESSCYEIPNSTSSFSAERQIELIEIIAQVTRFTRPESAKMSCTSLLCDNDATTLSLSCETSGDSTEKISAITAVGINSTSLACDTLETNPYFSVCNLDAATELIEEYCLDKTKCTINAASIISATCPTTQGLELFAKITCKANPTISTTTILILVRVVILVLSFLHTYLNSADLLGVL